jgi:cytochrome c peroxidase
MSGLLGVFSFTGIRSSGAVHEPTPPGTPLGLPPVFWPDDNPYTPEKADLGKLLYFDTRLSTDGTVSCASCHAPEKAFTDNAPVSTGISNQKGGRSAPTVINRAYTTLQFWDGRAKTLEEQAKGPLANPLEMTVDKEADKAHEAVVSRIRKIPGYAPLFRKVFGERAISIDQVAQAIATFERTVVSGNAPYDRYRAGDLKAMTDGQERGMKLFFGKARCDSCHLGFNFSDESFMNIGIGWEKGTPEDLGRYKVTGREEDKGAFKTPTLREIARTGPYMHDGSMTTLEEVVEHYNKGGVKNPYLSQSVKPLGLTEKEKADLLDFLKHGLSGEGWQQITAPKADEFPR